MSDFNNLQYLDYLRSRANFKTRKAAADYFEVNERTWRRWEKTNSAKRHIYELLKNKIGYFSQRGWEGFKFENNFLYTPEGRPITAQQLENLSLMFDYAKAENNPHLEDCLKESKNTWLLFNKSN